MTATTTAAAFNVFRISLPLKKKRRARESPQRKNLCVLCELCVQTSCLPLRRRGRLLREDLAEDLQGLRHLLHRAEGDARVRLLERREVARDDDALGAAG